MSDFMTLNEDGSAASKTIVNAGSVSIEQERAIAEARGQIQIAKMFPRNLNAVYAEVMEACKLKALAEIAFYTVPQGGQKVTGPSIKLIEQVASACEHFIWGHRELSRTEAGIGPKDFGRSEVEVYAWDMQKNNKSLRQITVLHVLDTKEGPRKLRDQRDIDNKIANVASKQMRGRLQALLPKWLIQAAVEQCQQTLLGKSDEPISVRVRKMTQAFSKYGVTADHLERYLGHGLDDVMIDSLVDLTGVYNALKDGASPSEYFDAAETNVRTVNATVDTLNEKIVQQESKPAAKAAAKPKAEPKPKQEPKPEPEPLPEPEAEAEPETEAPSTDKPVDLF